VRPGAAAAIPVMGTGIVAEALALDGHDGLSAARRRRERPGAGPIPDMPVAAIPRGGQDGAMRPPVPPFTEETARQKVQAAEDAWNTREPERVAAAYSEDSQWRNRDEFFTGRAAIVDFLTRKWDREQEYALRKDLWAFTANRIAVRFQYESRDASGQWWRSYGNEQWEFDDEGYMRRREASINDVAIDEGDRRIFGPRPEDERGQGIPLA
jgi:uncharacterized protein